MATDFKVNTFGRKGLYGAKKLVTEVAAQMFIDN